MAPFIQRSLVLTSLWASRKQITAATTPRLEGSRGWTGPQDVLRATWLMTPDARTIPTGGIFGTSRRNPASRSAGRTTRAKSFGISRRRTSLAWSAFCPTQDEHPGVPNSSSFDRVDTCGGPTATLLCVVLCHPHAASAAYCEHRESDSTPSVAAQDGW